MARRPQKSSERLRSRVVSYHEQTTSDDEASDEVSQPRPQQKPPRTSRQTATISKQTVRKRTAVKRVELGRKRRRLERAPAEQALGIESDDHIPQWATLPYEIIHSIVAFAAEPTSAAWLLGVARTCTSFTLPALAILHESPRLLSLDKPHRLLQHLRHDAASAIMNYRLKIKRLEMQTWQSLAYTCPGRGLFDLCELLPLLPLLESLEIGNVNDQPPFRHVSNKGRWCYPIDMFSVLDSSNIKLKRWRWNGEMLGDMVHQLHHIHMASPFRHLQHLALSQMHIPSDETNAETFPYLQSLKTLALTSCSSDDWTALTFFPPTLRRLEIINCATIDSGVVTRFLHLYGRQLHTLRLNHNHGLDLRFLEDLATHCPKLESLTMDLTFYSSYHVEQWDLDPTYVCLLPDTATPTWPSTLQQLELLHLRKWTVDAAENLLESLINAAPNLPYLRQLIIHAMLNMAWRDRAGFRDKWRHTMQEVFLRRPQPPSPHLVSFKAYRQWKAQKTVETQNKTRNATKRTKESSKEIAQRTRTCDVVDVSFDNSRPSEFRFREDDFMDDEPSGDEDWNEGSRSSPPRYAW